MEQTPDKNVPQPNTDFGNESPDTTPINQGRFGGINEIIFSLMRPKRKPERTLAQQPLNTVQSNLSATPFFAAVDESPVRSFRIPVGMEIRNGLLMQKKTLAERVRDQLQHPGFTKIDQLIPGIALLVFAVGAGLLYSSLPTRPELVVGILMVTIAGNILISSR